MSREARQYPRYAMEAAVTLTGAHGVSKGRTSNVSRGGLCAEVDVGPPGGSNVTVEIMLVFDADTFSEPLTLPARVAWATNMGDRHQVGLTFASLTDEGRDYLEMFLRYLEAAEAAADEDDEPDVDPDDPFAS